MNCNIITPVLALVGVIVGAVITGIFSYISIVGATKKHEFLKAAANFRASFVTEIRKLKRKFIHNDLAYRIVAARIIDSALDEHEIAVLKFRDYLPERKRCTFDLAWKQYSEPNIEEYPESPRLDYEAPDLGEDELNARKLIIERINELLKFAELK